MKRKKQSRRVTPWDKETELTTTQAFLKTNYETYYADRHRVVASSGEAEMINAYIPAKCPYCGSPKFKRSGRTKSGVQRYMCECKKSFIPTTGTIFDEHRISISEWMEYCLDIFRHVSITASSWGNKNAFMTSRYWLQKLFITLEGSQNDIILSGRIWLDETFYTVITKDIIYRDDGKMPRGLSQNQICIGVATDRKHSVFYVEGTGKPSQKKTYEIFRNHIKPSSTLIHDGDNAHTKLIRELSLKSVAYASKDLKGLQDKDNPMNPINRVHAILKRFLNAHSGFSRDDLQGYLNLFAFVTNPPSEMLEKVELVIKMAFQNPKLLRYRDFYGLITALDHEDSNTGQ